MWSKRTGETGNVSETDIEMEYEGGSLEAALSMGKQVRGWSDCWVGEDEGKCGYVCDNATMDRTKPIL